MSDATPTAGTGETGRSVRDPLPEMPPLGGRQAAGGARGAGMSENKRINALNLEPTLPRPAENMHNSMGAQGRGSNRPADIKREFQASLTAIKNNEAVKEKRRGGSGTGDTPVGQPGDASQQLGHSTQPEKGESNVQARGGATPGGLGPQLHLPKSNPKLLGMSVLDLLEPFFQVCTRSGGESEQRTWPNSTSRPYSEYLGQPDPSKNTAVQNMLTRAGPNGGNAIMMQPGACGGMGGQDPSPGGSWQQQQVRQQQQQQGQMVMGGNGMAMPMMQQGYMIQPQMAQQQMGQPVNGHMGQQMQQPQMWGGQPQMYQQGMQQQQQGMPQQQQQQGMPQQQQQGMPQQQQQQMQQQQMQQQQMQQQQQLMFVAGQQGMVPQQMMNQGMMVQMPVQQGGMGNAGGQPQMMMMPMMMGGQPGMPGQPGMMGQQNMG